MQLPTIPGNGVGGVVDGRRVLASLGGAGGGYAERVAVDPALLFDVPDGMALDHAVALLADGRTATMLLRAAADCCRASACLVEAAAGGVGTQLVQLAKAAGATVVAAAGSAAKLELARSLGADELVDYTVDGVGRGVARRGLRRRRRCGRPASVLAAGAGRADAQLRPRLRFLGGDQRR